MAFVLRHFPQLRKCPFNGQTCEALHLLHKQQQQPPKISSLSTSQRSSEDRDIVRWNLNAPFQGRLNLIALERIYCNSRIYMESIAVLGPFLKEVKFYFKHRHQYLNESPEDYYLISPEQLRSLLSSTCSNWSKVESITFSQVDFDYRRVVLDCLGGSQLHKLTLTHCQDFDPIAELLPLKTLKFLSVQNCTLTPIANAAALAQRVPRAILADCANKFLPQLKELIVDVTCLGYWSRLFECPRPSLIKWTGFCSHLGFPSVSRFDWSDAPLMWPNMKKFGFYNNHGSAPVNTFKSLVPYLNEFQHLEKLLVPAVISESWISFPVLDILAQTGHPLPVGVRITEQHFTSTYNCFFQQEQEEQQEDQ